MTTYLIFMTLTAVVWLFGSASDSLAVGLTGLILFHILSLKEQLKERDK